MVNAVMKKRNEEARNAKNDELKKQKEHQDKMDRRKRKRAAREEKMIQESKDSYLTKEQYEFLNKKIEMAHKRLKEQQLYIDTMELKMIEHLTKRDTKAKEREEEIALNKKAMFPGEEAVDMLETNNIEAPTYKQWN